MALHPGIGPAQFIHSNFTTNSTAPGICELSHHARALSSVLTAFVGSIIGSIGGSEEVVGYILWICWFGTARILVTGFWEMVEAVCLRPLEGGAQFCDFYGQFPFLKSLTRDWAGFDAPSFREGAEAMPPTFLGWVGWLFATCYAPTSQILWLISNWNSASGFLKIARALGVVVIALPLTMDTKARYGAALENLLGCWSRCVFSFMTAGACLVLGLISAVELVKGAIEWRVSWFPIVMYSGFALLGTEVGFSSYIPHDEAWSPRWTFGAVVAQLFMGAILGVVTAMPAFIVMLTANKTPGLGIGEYIRCEPVALWRKFTALFP